MQWKVEINDSKYSSWKYIAVSNTNAFSLTSPQIHPATAHLFHGDQFIMDTDYETPILTISPLRSKPNIAGVILFSSPPCGKCTRTGKMLWRVIPHNRHFPEFIVPATQKIGFAKNRVNAYVLFAFRQWTQTHPEGVLKETIGPVDDISAYYTYSLHSKDLYYSLAPANTAVKTALKTNSQILNYSTIIDRRTDIMISYDSPGALIFDDAIAVHHLPLDPNFIQIKKIRISIAIANVCATIDALDSNIWNVLPHIAMNIYMPNAKHPMLPSALGDLCSLHANNDRLAMILDIDIDLTEHDNNIVPTIVAYSFTEIAIVNVVHNATFNDVINEQLILNIAHAIDPSIAKDDVSSAVRVWMRIANTHFAKIFTRMNVPAIFMDETKGGYNTDFNLATYARITCPIRRAADLTNQIIIIGVYASNNAREFAKHYLQSVNTLAELEYSTKKVQSVARIVDIQRKYNELKESYSGISQLGGMVFFPELKVWFRDPRESVEIGIESQFVIALFPGEYLPYRKVRIMALY